MCKCVIMFYGIEIYLKRFKRVRTISWTIATCFPCDLPPVMAAQKINEVLHLGKQKKGTVQSFRGPNTPPSPIAQDCLCDRRGRVFQHILGAEKLGLYASIYGN
ncbi:hypothetical protein XELAEV_18037130mg [Xenopus laevis]|uniref:Uncharacterized protein n=1 Tax=Xenopus laevis TaxID=8355 RepID=A0A974CBK4_XENLA|nr:hypothetical protein XELAEV_18037130mg [Xenopus laevis]